MALYSGMALHSGMTRYTLLNDAPTIIESRHMMGVASSAIKPPPKERLERLPLERLPLEPPRSDTS